MITIDQKIRSDLPAEWRRCDFLRQGQILFGGGESNTVTIGENIVSESKHNKS